VDAERHEEHGQVEDQRGHDPGQDRSLAVAEVEHRGQAGEEQGAEEAQHEQRVDDRGVDRLERADERAIVGPAQAGHDGVGVDAEDAGHEAHRHRGRDQGSALQHVHRIAFPSGDIGGQT
jgi:hypothetical protein